MKALRQELAWCVKGGTSRLVLPGHRSEGRTASLGEGRSMGTVVKPCRALGDAVRIPAFYSEFYERFRAES